MKQHAQLAALLLAASVAAVAQDTSSKIFRLNGGDWVEEITGTLAPGKIVRIKTTSGPIHLTGGQQNNIVYTVRKHVRAASADGARREFARLRFTAVNSAGQVLLHGECENDSRGYVSFDVTVPSQTVLAKLETSGGTISARNITGRVEAVTGGESIQVDQIGGSVFASSGGGNIEIGKIGGDVRVETGGGKIQVASAGGQVVASSGGGPVIVGVGKKMKLQTGAGSIQVDRCSGEIKASTGGGTIDVNDVDGPAQFESGGGSVRVGPIHGGLHVDTGSGPIIADLAKGGGIFTDSRLETSAGDIIVYIPDDLGVTIRATVEAARGAGIRTDFPGVKITSGSELGPREVYAEGALNGGGALLHVHTTSGTIEIKRKNK
ncbi:MAG TPA: hypothetical protein VI685_00200 [Candidatus Angelobacter sp.]